MHYLVTGHTGFKGAWLTLMLAERGHRVSGIALDPLPGSLYEIANLDQIVEADHRFDIRDAEATRLAVESTNADVVLHMAAQPLVRDSYRDPRGTIETNVMGTLNVLEAVAATDSVKANVVVTTDKVYRNTGRSEGYGENDALGAADPYSSSKAMADILTQSWVFSFDGPPTAIVRAGNVIGGGDVSPDRLLPDLLSAFRDGRTTEIRFPDAIRPWQHVLDCLAGYLALVDALLDGNGAGEWNFGPGPESFVPVRELADEAVRLWGDGATWKHTGGDHPHEAAILALDAAKAERELGWTNKLRFPDSVEWTVQWERQYRERGDALATTQDMIANFEGLGARVG